MSLPYLANLFALRSSDPEFLHQQKQILRASFSQVVQPHPLWLVAIQPLPRSEEKPPLPQGLFFVEGIERFSKVFEEQEKVRGFFQKLKHSPHQLGRYPGDFGFLWISPEGEVRVVRSVGGLVPWYFVEGPRFMAFATRLEYLVRFLPFQWTLDPLPHAMWAMGWTGFPNRRTFFRGVRILERGSFLALSPEGKKREGRYWTPPRFQVHFPNRRERWEHAEELRYLLLKYLHKTLDPQGGNLLTLSGGVDSSALLSLAAGVLEVPVMTWTLVPPREFPHLYAHERTYLAPLRKRYKVRTFWEVPYSREGVASFWLRGPRLVFHVLHPALCDLPRVLREASVSVLFGGEFADNVTGQVYTLPDWAESLSLFHLLLVLPELRHRPKDFWLWFRYRTRILRRRLSLPLPAYLLTRFPGNTPVRMFRREVVEEFEEWYQEQVQEFFRNRPPWRYLELESRLVDGFVVMNWEATSALGIRRAFPFFHREIFEWVFRLHPIELYGGGVKKVLRLALHHLVPHRNLYRPDKGWWGRNLDRSFWETKNYTLPFQLDSQLFSGLLEEVWLHYPLPPLKYPEYRVLVRIGLFQEGLYQAQQKSRL